MVSMLDLERFRATPLTHEPFEFLIVPEFVKADARSAIVAVGELRSNEVATAQPLFSHRYSSGSFQTAAWISVS